MTADGNNNTGKLTIPFGAEGMDTISGGDVFNGKMNVYWQFVYGLYPARRLMWQNREAVGTWNADAYLNFATGWQNYVPERAYNQDYWYKYLRPYEQNNDTTYISMLEGGKKVHQREAFVRNNLTYMASQYTGTYCTSDSITVRAYTPGVSDDMTPEEAAIINRTIAAVPPNPVVQVMLYNKGYIVVEVASVMKRVKAEKGVYYTIDFSESSSAMNDTVVNIHGAGNVRAIGDMSSLYIKFCNFAKAARLRSLQIGSSVEGYTNLGLESVGFESNPMLEELYVQNCPNSATTLDLSGCQSLKILDIRGSGFTGVSFATGGLIEEAHLGSPASLNMRNLYYLTDNKLSLESYSNLTTLRFEDVPGVDSLNIVNQATKLSTARILGLDWTLSETAVLNRMLTLRGLDEADHATDVSILTGDAYISGAIRNKELENYSAAWNNLNVTYNPNNLIEQYLATYVNYDGTVLYTVYVDRGQLPPDPVALGLIDTPVQPSTAQYTFTYTGFSDITTVMLSPRTITAQYDSNVRSYTVNWYSRAGLLLASTTASYGDEVVYPNGLPTNTSEEDSFIYNVFTGWDKSTGFITGDIDVYAVWERASLPSPGRDLSTMSCTEISGICTSGNAENYFEDKDHFDLHLGNDFDFSNVESRMVLRDRFFDGNQFLDTDIKLFSADAPSFTLAIEYEFVDTNESGASLVSCFEENGTEGFRLRFNTNPTLQWGDKTAVVGAGAYRNIIVLRHQHGSRTMFVYSFNKTAENYDMEMTTVELVRTRETEVDSVLTFGAARFLADGGHDYYAKGWIHWCKVWYADLGITVARKLAAWTHDTVRMEFAGPNRYRLASTTSQRANAYFVANNPLPLLFHMNATNTNAGGWDASRRREFFNTRLWEGLPYKWQSVIKLVRVPATAGSQSTEILVSNDHLYSPSLREVGGSASEPYASEGELISYYSSATARCKFPGIIIKDNPQIITGDTDPTLLTSYTVTEGDIWVHTGIDDSPRFIYLAPETIANHTIIAQRAVNSTSNVAASDGGLWVRATTWFVRSPGVSTSSHFWYVRPVGSLTTTNASSFTGAVFGFSI